MMTNAAIPFDRERLRREIAAALVDVTNDAIRPNFPPDLHLRNFDECDERERELNLAYADAALEIAQRAVTANARIVARQMLKFGGLFEDPETGDHRVYYAGFDLSAFVGQLLNAAPTPDPEARLDAAIDANLGAGKTASGQPGAEPAPNGDGSLPPTIEFGSCWAKIGLRRTMTDMDRTILKRMVTDAIGQQPIDLDEPRG